MPYGLDTHVLTVDAKVIHKVDTANPHALFSMWTVFSRCAESVEQGRRLENLSWRLWQREQLCSDTNEKIDPLPMVQPRDIPDSRILDLPQLSASVDSADEEAVDLTTSVSAPLDICPRIKRIDSTTSSRSRRERHISPDDFEKLIVKIKDNAPLSEPLPVIQPLVAPKPEEPTLVPSLERSGSTTTESTNKTEESECSQHASSPEITSRTTVVRGFSPSPVAIPRIVPTAELKVPAVDAIPEPRSSPAPKIVQSKNQPKFALGGSYSSCEKDNSPEPPKGIMAKSAMFQLGRGSSGDSSASTMSSARPNMAQKKQTSFSDQVSMRTIENVAVEEQSETEGDCLDESAIEDDDDSSDWEDSMEDSGKSSMDDKTMFQRVDSKANLTTRRSLITLMLERNQTNKNLNSSQSTSALQRSRTAPIGPMAASPSDSDEAPLMMKQGNRPSTLRPINEVPRSAAQPIHGGSHQVHHQAALSPRTTRRNMLATELTESLRRHLLWERQQKSSTANAVLKRRHTSQDVANLKQYPETAYMNKKEDANASSWNQYFSKEAFNGYHSKGW